MGTEDAFTTTAALATTTGVVYLGLGIAKLGWIADFPSRAVMGGSVLVSRSAVDAIGSDQVFVFVSEAVDAAPVRSRG